MAAGVALNSLVRIKGVASEYHGMTTLQSAETPLVCPLMKTAPGIQPVAVDGSQDLEQYEGMLVEVTSKLLITDTSRTWRYGELGCATKLRFQPTDAAVPMSAAYDAVVAENKLGNFIVEDNSSSTYPDLLSWYPYQPVHDKPINVGARVTGVVGPLMFASETWRTCPLSEVTLEQTRASPDGPEGLDRTGAVVVGSFNLLNYFNGKVVDGKVSFSSNSRGATSAAQFDLQARKIANALHKMDADIVGVMEIENDGFGVDSALASLISDINPMFPATKQYAYAKLSVPKIGTDVIACGLIYRPEVFALSGDAWTIAMPMQRYTKNGNPSLQQMRPALVQNLHHLETGKVLTVVVNHLRSKGGTCYEDSVTTPEPRDEAQGSCSALRVSAAMALGKALAESPAVAERQILLGDFNSYRNEDPVAVLTGYDPATRGYTIQTAHYIMAESTELEGSIQPLNVTQPYNYVNVVPGGYSYTYSGQLGSLDFVFASPKLAAEVQSAAHWHINSIEIPEMMYSKALAYYEGYNHDGVYRSSDHDPVVVALKLMGEGLTPVPRTESPPSTDAPPTPVPPTPVPPEGTSTPRSPSPPGTPSVAGLIITEYTEGKSYNKAVELTNTGTTSIDFASTAYILGVYSSGKTTRTSKIDINTGTLDVGKSMIVANNQMDESFFSKSAVAASLVVKSGSLNFNGDDTVDLRDASETLLDVVGAFPMGSKWLGDVTIRRKASDTTGNPSGFSEVAGNWVTKATTADTLDVMTAGFGCSGTEACT